MSKVLDKDGLGYYTDELCTHISGTYLPRSESVWIKGPSGSAYLDGNSTVGGKCSVAYGYQTTASGYYSHAEGKINRALGDGSHAEGNYTTASGGGSHAEGLRVVSLGNFSHAEGRVTTASGEFSHAEGRDTNTLGQYSHAEGSFTTASGMGSHAEGYFTEASGTFSHAEGKEATAAASGSHAEGFHAKARGDCAHAEGSYTYATGYCSHAEGSSVESYGMFTHAEGDSTYTHGPFSHAEGRYTRAIGSSSHAEGLRAVAINEYSHAEGCLTTASGMGSHAEGYNTLAAGSYSHAEGSCTTASGDSSHVEGYKTIAVAPHSTAIGTFNVGYTNTLFEIGNGSSEESRSNALTVFSNGTVEIPGLAYSSLEEVTYEEACTCQGQFRLRPGVLYRITDYLSGSIYLQALSRNTFATEGYYVKEYVGITEQGGSLKLYRLESDQESIYNNDEDEGGRQPWGDDYLLDFAHSDFLNSSVISIGNWYCENGDYDDPYETFFYTDQGEYYYREDSDPTLEIDGETYWLWGKYEEDSGDHIVLNSTGQILDWFHPNTDPVGYIAINASSIPSRTAPQGNLVDNSDFTRYPGQGGTLETVTRFFYRVKYALETGSSVLDSGVLDVPTSGTILWMQDQYGNEAPYDFVNIKPGGKFTFGTEDENYALDPANGVYNNKILPRYENGVQVINNVNFAVTGSHSNTVYPSCNNVSIDFKVAESMISMNSQGGLAIFNPTEFITPIAGTPLV